MVKPQLQKAARSSSRIAARAKKANASSATGTKTKKRKSFTATPTPKNVKSSTPKGRARGQALAASTVVVQPGSSTLATTPQVQPIPPQVSQPHTANPAMLVGYHNPQYEESDSDEGDQLTPLYPQYFSGHVAHPLKGVKIPIYSGNEPEWEHYKAKLKSYARIHG